MHKPQKEHEEKFSTRVFKFIAIVKTKETREAHISFAVAHKSPERLMVGSEQSTHGTTIVINKEEAIILREKLTAAIEAME